MRDEREKRERGRLALFVIHNGGGDKKRRPKLPFLRSSL